jgi:hypothetical protein
MIPYPLGSWVGRVLLASTIPVILLIVRASLSLDTIGTRRIKIALKSVLLVLAASATGVLGFIMLLVGSVMSDSRTMILDYGLSASL